MKKIQEFLNQLTMYKLMHYFLIVLISASVIFSFLGILPYNPWHILFTTLFLVVFCQASNFLFSRLFRTHVNPESQVITGLILSLIVGPFSPLSNPSLLIFLAVVAMAGKYVLAWNQRHTFNPAGFAIVASALVLGQGASWWVGSIYLLPFVVIGGLLVARKIKAALIIETFLAVYLLGLAATVLTQGASLTATGSFLLNTLQNSSLLFFSFVMLVEPLTSPQNRKYQVFYAVIVALALLTMQNIVPNITYSLELALLIGNVFTRLFSPDWRAKLKLLKKEELTPSTVLFHFEKPKGFKHIAGQYLDWTLYHAKPDNRGIRRWFTISASPTEKELMLTTKFAPEKSSTFKNTLHKLKLGEDISIAGLKGTFTLPPETNKPLVFIAGGIGITPFRSMIKYLLDTNEKRDIILMYSNRTPGDIVFKDLLEEAEKKFGLRTIYTVTEDIPKSWKGKTGYIDEAMIKKEIPDYKDRLFYVSGPEPMVEAFEKMLVKMGIKKSSIKRDDFPGYTETHQAK